MDDSKMPNEGSSEQMKDHWLEEGQTHYTSQRYEEALSAFEQVLRLRPTSDHAWIWKGCALSKLQRHEEALAAFEQALQLNLTNANAWEWKGSVLSDLQRNEEALSAYDQALVLDSTYANAWKMKGITLAKLQRYEEALVAFEQALTLDPTIIRAWEGKISALYRLQRYEEVLTACAGLLQLAPKNAYAWLEQGHAHAHLQRYDAALFSYERALELDPRDVFAWEGRGSVLDVLQRNDGALAAYEQALELDPTYAAAWFKKAAVLFRLQRFEEALAAYERGLERDAKDADAWTSKGNLLSWLHRSEEALKAYEQALAVDPSHPDARASKERVLSHLRQQVELRVAYEQAFKDGTRSARLFEGLNVIPWADLSHAYGSAEEVPVWLRQLASADEQIRRMAMGKLGSSLYHQGSIYPATAYAVPYLIALLQEPTLQGKEDILGLLNAIVNTSPLDEQMWYGEEGAEFVGAWGAMPRQIPYQDSHAAIEAALPLYSTLLDAPTLIVRLEAANILTRFPHRADELWPVLQAALEREQTEAGRADLVLALGRQARHLPEKRAFFLERFQTDQSELGAFAAALVVVRLAKESTPEEVAQILLRVMFEAPSSLDLYLRLPCGGTYPWSTALWALANLGPERLTPLVPVVEAHLQQIRNTYGAVELFARLLLFIVFKDQPERGHPSRPAEALDLEQRHLLLVLLEQDQVWQRGNFSSLLKAYGLPGTRKEMAAYLGQEAPVEPPREPLSRPQRPSQVDSYREAIQEVYPQLSLRMLGGKIQMGVGADDYLTFNENLLFRFPRQAQALEVMEREIALLRALQDRLPLPIPNPVYASQRMSEMGRAFIGYPLPPGKLLSKELLESVDGEETVQELAEQLAAFLAALHHLPVTELAHLSLSEAPTRAGLEALYGKAREELFPHMSPEQQVYITTHFETFLARPEHFAVKPVLVHGNFGPETIFYHRKERRISGVIDFSRACLGDPALDFARLVGPAGYGEAFLQRWVSRSPELLSLLERARFYATVVGLEDALRKRNEQTDKVPIPSQLREIDRIFYESSKLWEGDGETPLLSYYFA